MANSINSSGVDTYVGTARSRVDGPAKVTGAEQFGARIERMDPRLGQAEHVDQQRAQSMIDNLQIATSQAPRLSLLYPRRD